MDIAVSLMDEMIKFGLAPNVVTYTALINGYRKMGDVNKAHKMYKIMLEQDILPDTMACLSLGLNLDNCGEEKG